jgi:hypothetical protein
MARRRAMAGQRRIPDRELLQGMSYRMDFEQTGTDMISRIAHLVFDPPFYVLHRLLLLMRW